MGLTKLDTYDYSLHPGVIRIRVQATNDPDILDIFSEIENSGGRIYVDGYYYCYLDRYDVITEHGEVYLDLQVTDYRTA